jgi:hypothetical protein
MRTLGLLCMLMAWACSDGPVEVEVDVDVDVEVDVEVDVDVEAEVEGPRCEGCELDAERCDGPRVLRCAELASESCTVWVVGERCDVFQVCDAQALRCVERPVEPVGFEVGVAEIGSGVHVLDLLWDGVSGLAVFQTLRGSEPVLGLARFDRDGPVGAPVIRDGVGRTPRLVASGGEIAMVWLDGGGRAQLGSVVTNGLTDVRDVSRATYAGNLHASWHHQGIVLLQQDSGQVFVDLLAPGRSPRPYELEARLGWYRPTVAVLPDAEHGDLAVWIDAESDTIELGRFSTEGTRVTRRSWPVGSTFELPAVLGVIPGTGDASPHVVWSAVTDAERFEVFVGRIGPELELTPVGDTGAVDIDFGLSARLLGHHDDRFWLSFASRDGHSLRFAELGLDGRLHQARTLLPEGLGAAAVHDNELAFCWGVDFEGLRCRIEAIAP